MCADDDEAQEHRSKSFAIWTDDRPRQEWLSSVNSRSWVSFIEDTQCFRNTEYLDALTGPDPPNSVIVTTSVAVPMIPE